MKRLPTLQSRPPAVRLCARPIRCFSTKIENTDSSKTQPESSTPDERNQDDLGFGDWSEVNPDEKTIDTAVGALPVSPLLDPKWREARDRGRTKPPPDKSKHNRFQRVLTRNPFAQMLATPLRQCRVTGARLPRAFFQNFGLVRHPQTDDLWWIPVGMTPTHQEAAVESSNETGGSTPPAIGDEEGTSNGAHHAGGPASADEAAATGEVVTAKEASTSVEAAPSYQGIADSGTSSAASSKNTPTEPKHTIPAPSHTLARQDLLQAFLAKKTKYKGGQFRLAPRSIIQLANTAIWREDMDSVILDLSRRQIVQDLCHLTRLCEEQGRRYLVKMDHALESEPWNHRSCFLWLGEDKRPSRDEAAGPETAPVDTSERSDEGPEQFAAWDTESVPQSAYPVYNLPRLLGTENTQRLRSEFSLLRQGPVFLLRGRRGDKLNMLLWKLQGYTADYEKLK